MNDLLSLIERGTKAIERKLGSTLTIATVPYVCVKASEDQASALAPGYSMDIIASVVYVRKAIIADLRAIANIGKFVTLNGEAMKIEHYSEDESGWVIFLSHRSK